VPVPPDQERIREVWQRYAPRYGKHAGGVERLLFGDGRAWVCSRAIGDVLEVAIGTGRNLPCYPESVRLVGIDFSPAMVDIARAHAEELGLDVDLRQGDAQDLDFPDESFDSVVCTLALCCIQDTRRAISEMRRVLRPGGKLLLLDHVASRFWPVRLGQRLIEQLTVRVLGEYWTRRPLPLVRGAGFVIERAERFRLGAVERLVATKPDPA